ncbi:integrase core domain-containing protein [Halomonas jincaotanensis]|uniref:integrase core domain-containing protein n=1 Tax=Halomonas jincaotanensis TaxID=2810616 RepID=UPI002022E07D|nr:integrase core domain-containing protein [Halomonas jincaotanensis]
MPQQRTLPASIVCDNGPEVTSKATFFWARERKVTLAFIQPGKPTQNAFIESFNDKFRDGCLNQHWFLSLTDARHEIDQWRAHYNHVSPHSSLGYMPPIAYAQRCAQRNSFSHCEWTKNRGKVIRTCICPTKPTPYNPHSSTPLTIVIP